MKSPKLSSKDKTTAQQMGELLMQMNARDDANASQYPAGHPREKCATYGLLWRAIVAFVLNQTGVDLTDQDVNWGGYASAGHDIQEAVFAVVQRQHDAERQKVCDACPEGNLTAPAVRAALKAHGVRLMRDANRTDYIVSIKGESAALWFISSSLLECFEQGQRKALCALSGRAYVSPY